jgi:hypothetical protein
MVGENELATGASPADACLETVNVAAKKPSIATAANTPTQIFTDDGLFCRKVTPLAYDRIAL